MELSDFTNPLETLWDHLLSRDPEKVWAAFRMLTTEEQGAILAHLNRMAEEPGWHPEQRLSAKAALLALAERPLRQDDSD